MNTPRCNSPYSSSGNVAQFDPHPVWNICCLHARVNCILKQKIRAVGLLRLGSGRIKSESHTIEGDSRWEGVRFANREFQYRFERKLVGMMHTAIPNIAKIMATSVSTDRPDDKKYVDDIDFKPGTSVSPYDLSALEILDRADLIKLVSNLVGNGVFLNFHGKRSAQEIAKRVRPRVTRRISDPISR